MNENPEMSSLSDHMHMEKHADNQEKMEQKACVVSISLTEKVTLE